MTPTVIIHYIFSRNNDNESEHKVYIYFNEDDNWVSASAGDYMLLAAIDETYNYDNIVTPAVPITVTAPQLS